MWLEKELKKKGYEVIKPSMPDPAHPKITPWVNKLVTVAKNADEFKKKLGSKIIIEKNKGHFEEGKTGKIPVIIKED